MMLFVCLFVRLIIQGVFLTVNLGYSAKLGVSRSIYVNVDTPNLGFTYLN